MEKQGATKATTANHLTSKPAVVHTKRKEIEGKDGWTHVVEAPRRNPKAKGRAKANAIRNSLIGGDFKIDGVSYVKRTLAEMTSDFEYFRKQWLADPACKELQELLKGMEKVGNIISLGLGSLQVARREGRRGSATQLAALQTIASLLLEGDRQIIFQDPQFTDLDREFLQSLGYKIVADPEAFTEIHGKTLVYAVHCYATVYKSALEKDPAVLIGTDVTEFGMYRGESDLDPDGSISQALEDMASGFETLDFPQVRHDFSDTKIYHRKAVLPELNKLSLEG